MSPNPYDLSARDRIVKAAMPKVRHFTSGATRDVSDNKPDYEGFIHPLVLIRYGQYMHKHRHLPDGSLRASDNWQKGIPQAQYMKSLLRHVMDAWVIMRGHPEKAVERDLEEVLCAVIFNAMGLLHEVLLKRDVKDRDPNSGA